MADSQTKRKLLINLVKTLGISLCAVVACICLTSCGNTKEHITRKEYNEMMKVVKLNDDYDLIDVRSALYSFAPKLLNAKSQDDIDTAISYISDYSTSLLTSSLKTSSYNSQGEQQSVVGIYYCYPDKSEDGKGKFLIISNIDSSTDYKNYSYIMMTLNSEGKLAQIERW